MGAWTKTTRAARHLARGLALAASEPLARGRDSVRASAFPAPRSVCGGVAARILRARALRAWPSRIYPQASAWQHRSELSQLHFTFLHVVQSLRAAIDPRSGWLGHKPVTRSSEPSARSQVTHPSFAPGLCARSQGITQQLQLQLRWPRSCATWLSALALLHYTCSCAIMVRCCNSFPEEKHRQARFLAAEKQKACLTTTARRAHPSIDCSRKRRTSNTSSSRALCSRAPWTSTTSTMQRAGGGGGGGGGTGWTSTAMANAWGANSGQDASGKDSPWSGAHAGAMTPAGSTATAARDSRRERLAQRCKDRLKSARRDRLRTHRIRTLAEQVIREEIGALEEPLCEEDLLRLEKEVLAELYADEERALRELEAEDRARARELEHYARQEEAMSSTHEQQQRSIQTASSAQLLCPVCMRAHLHLRGTVFHCDCGFRLDAKNECISLEQLRQRLAHAMESHAMQAPPCGHQPQFSLKRHLAGIELLVMECQGCACFHVVL